MRWWAAHQKSLRKTIDLLIKEGFESMEALLLIDSDDLSKTKIQRGQQKLLLKALLSLTSSGEDTGSAAATNGDDTPATGTRDAADATIVVNETHADGTQGTHADGIQGTHADGIQGTHSDGTQGTHADGIQGTHSDGIQGTHADGIQGTHSDGIQGTHSDGIQGTHADGIQGTHSDGIQGTHTDGIQGTHSDGIQ